MVKLYKVYLNTPHPLASVYGFRKIGDDDRPSQKRYLEETRIDDYISEMEALGLEDLELEEIK